jgi:hypothetical protein
MFLAAAKSYASPLTKGQVRQEDLRSLEAALNANAEYFEGAEGTGSYLTARGFNERGDRSGSIVGPKAVTVPAGAILFRLFHLERQTFGQWWSTAHELAAIFRHFGRAGPA